MSRMKTLIVDISKYDWRCAMLKCNLCGLEGDDLGTCGRGCFYENTRKSKALDKSESDVGGDTVEYVISITDTWRSPQPFSREGLFDALAPGLEELFAQEYQKYPDLPDGTKSMKDHTQNVLKALILKKQKEVEKELLRNMSKKLRANYPLAKKNGM